MERTDETPIRKLLNTIERATLDENWEAVERLDDELLYARNLMVSGKGDEADKVANDATLSYCIFGKV